MLGIPVWLLGLAAAVGSCPRSLRGTLWQLALAFAPAAYFLVAVGALAYTSRGPDWSSWILVGEALLGFFYFGAVGRDALGTWRSDVEDRERAPLAEGLGAWNCYLRALKRVADAPQDPAVRAVAREAGFAAYSVIWTRPHARSLASVRADLGVLALSEDARVERDVEAELDNARRGEFPTSTPPFHPNHPAVAYAMARRESQKAR